VRLSQVFTSILRRAADAMPASDPVQREIRIVARREDLLRLVVEVSDDAPAAPQAELVGPVEALQGQRPAPRGSGAGLAAVIGMVRAVGGDVVAERVPEGGTVVRVHLPVAGAMSRA
jgi:C4-dicarboxylate-specific signal transduction histidine kinase